MIYIYTRFFHIVNNRLTPPTQRNLLGPKHLPNQRPLRWPNGFGLVDSPSDSHMVRFFLYILYKFVQYFFLNVWEIRNSAHIWVVDFAPSPHLLGPRPQDKTKRKKRKWLSNCFWVKMQSARSPLQERFALSGGCAAIPALPSGMPPVWFGSTVGAQATLLWHNVLKLWRIHWQIMNFQFAAPDSCTCSFSMQQVLQQPLWPLEMACWKPRHVATAIGSLGQPPARAPIVAAASRVWHGGCKPNGFQSNFFQMQKRFCQTKLCMSNNDVWQIRFFSLPCFPPSLICTNYGADNSHCAHEFFIGRSWPGVTCWRISKNPKRRFNPHYGGGSTRFQQPLEIVARISPIESWLCWKTKSKVLLPCRNNPNPNAQTLGVMCHATK